MSFSNLFFSFSFFLHTKQVHDYGRKVFEKIHVQNVVSWTTIIGGLVSYRDMDVAQRAFNQILTRNLWVYHLYNHRFFKINFELGWWVLYGFIKASCWFCETIICYKIPMFVVNREKYFGIIFRYILWLIFELLETYSSFSINRCYDQDERLNERFLVTCVWSKREERVIWIIEHHQMIY